jgi:hypothetical protein
VGGASAFAALDPSEDAKWGLGLNESMNQLRAALGPEAAIIGNYGTAKVGALNGRMIERGGSGDGAIKALQSYAAKFPGQIVEYHAQNADASSGTVQLHAGNVPARQRPRGVLRHGSRLGWARSRRVRRVAGEPAGVLQACRRAAGPRHATQRQHRHALRYLVASVRLRHQGLSSGRELPFCLLVNCHSALLSLFCECRCRRACRRMRRSRASSGQTRLTQAGRARIATSWRVGTRGWGMPSPTSPRRSALPTSMRCRKIRRVPALTTNLSQSVWISILLGGGVVRQQRTTQWLLQRTNGQLTA